MLSGGVVGRVQNIPGMDEAAEAVSTHNVPAGSFSEGGYTSSTSSSNGITGGSDDGADDSSLDGSKALSAGRGRRRMSTVAGGEGTPAAAAATVTPAPARSARPIRSFRAERVQGRSWSLEGGEVVTRGATGEEVLGPAAGGRSDFDGRRGRGGRRRGGRGGRR